MSERLRLHGAEAADAETISALAQDMLIAAGDVVFDPRARRVVLMGRRYRWERPGCSRVVSAIRVEHCLAVRRRAWPQSPAAPMDLLALTAEERDGAAHIRLHFAGGPALAIEAECVDLILEDLGHPFPCLGTPRHR